ncbi:MAG: hypothetical protein J6C75_00860 [Oscillospiraceae bacterium]|nr:hypothetical protein [Oscillospiraceae bacterium]
MSTSISDLYGINQPKNVNAIYDNDKSNADMGIEDFLQLMIAELKNQDFSSGESTDSTVYVTQLAQITTMQQMEQLAYYSKSNYVMNMVGKEVTVANLSLGGNVNTDTGVVEKISLSGDDFEVYVNGKAYSLSNVMSINNPDATVEEEMSAVNNMTPYLLKRGSETATVAWNAPESSDLSQYFFDVYYSESADFDTITQVKNGTLVGSFRGDDELYIELEDLAPETRYYVNIIMNTSDGKQEVYQKLIFDTKEEGRSSSFNVPIINGGGGSGGSSAGGSSQVGETPNVTEPEQPTEPTPDVENEQTEENGSVTDSTDESENVIENAPPVENETVTETDTTTESESSTDSVTETDSAAEAGNDSETDTESTDESSSESGETTDSEQQ